MSKGTLSDIGTHVPDSLECSNMTVLYSVIHYANILSQCCFVRVFFLWYFSLYFTKTYTVVGTRQKHLLSRAIKATAFSPYNIINCKLMLIKGSIFHKI